MHPEIRRDAPGICPECGMSLLPSKDHKEHAEKEHNHHAGPSFASSVAKAMANKKATKGKHSTQAFLRKFWVSLILTIPVVLYADIVQKISGWSPPDFPGSVYLPLVLGSAVFFYGGWVFLVGAWRELKSRLPGMMTLIGLAISAAYSYSVYATFVAPEHTLFWELTTLVTIMLLGHYLEMRAVSGAQGALKELAKLLPDTAELVTADGTIKKVALGALKEKDTVLVRPGAKIPADGKVLEGQSEVNESMATGESKLIGKKPGDEVIAGTINGDGSLKVEVTNIGEHTFLAGVMRLVQEAQASKSRLQILSDRAAFYLTLIAVTAGGITFAAWFFAGADINFAVARLVAVLVIACPHALGLAVPLVASISTNKAAMNGFLVKQRLALEAARNIDIVLFDKTGTLTKGEFAVTDIISSDERETLRLASSINSHSEHPLAKALSRKAEELKLGLKPVANFQRIPGKGVRGEINGETILVGNVSLIQENNVALDEPTASRIKSLSSQGKTINYVLRDKIFVGALALADIIRIESKEAIAALKAQGISTAMITGDSEDVAKWVAKELGIDEYFARVLPGEKANIVRKLQTGRKRVAMVGDGVNDAPALTQADLGVAIGAGTNVAIESAGIILVRNDPRDIAKIIKLSRLTYAKMMQNLFWATGYNIVALPLAAGVLAWQGIILQPALAAIFMSASTVIVAINAIMLKRKTL